jgi:hypothetical protein
MNTISLARLTPAIGAVMHAMFEGFAIEASVRRDGPVVMVAPHSGPPSRRSQ